MYRFLIIAFPSILHRAPTRLWMQCVGHHIEYKYRTTSELQKRAARIILQAYYMTPSVIMFDELRWLSLPKQLLCNKAILTYKALNNLTPAYISNLLKPILESHKLSLRLSGNRILLIPRSRTALYDRSFSYSVSELWNSLPQ